MPVNYLFWPIIDAIEVRDMTFVPPGIALFYAVFKNKTIRRKAGGDQGRRILRAYWPGVQPTRSLKRREK